MAKRKAGPDRPSLDCWYDDAEELLRVFDWLHIQFADVRPMRSTWQFEDDEPQPIGPIRQARLQAAETLQNKAEWILARLGSLGDVSQPTHADTLRQTAAALGVFTCGPLGECLTAWDALAPYGYAIRRWVAELAPFWQLDVITPAQNAMFQQHLENCPYSQDIQRHLRNRLRLEHGQLLRDNATQTAATSPAPAKRKRKRELSPKATMQEMVYFWLRDWHGYGSDSWQDGPVGVRELARWISGQDQNGPKDRDISWYFKAQFKNHKGYVASCRNGLIESWFRIREGETIQAYQGWQNSEED